MSSWFWPPPLDPSSWNSDHDNGDHDNNDDSISSSYSINNSNLIEGISDDTLLLFILVLSIITIWYYYTRRERNTTIHPDNRVDVELLRERQQQREEFTTSPSSSPASSTTTTRSTSSLLGQPRHDTCPICLNESTYSVETNCGHLFCGKCLISYWRFQPNWLAGMRCPVCRQPVTVLLPCFTADEQQSTDVDKQTIINDYNDFNRRFSGAPRTYLEYIRDIPVLIPHLIRQIFSVHGIQWAYRLRFITIFLLVIAYVISPFDLLPESAIGILGMLDDLFLFLCMLIYASVIYRQQLSQS